MRRPPLRFATAALAAATLALGLAACGSDDESGSASATTGGAPALETISEGKLTACTDAPYPPFEYEEGGRFTGFDMELIRAVGQNLGLELAVTVQPFDGIWLAPASGTCDVVASAMTITPARQRNALFSDPYFEADQSLLVRAADKPKYPDLASLAGDTVGVQTGTTGADYAEENAPESTTIRSFDEPAALFPALASGQIDAILQDFPVNRERARVDDAFAVTVDPLDTGESYGFAFAEDNTALKAAVDEQLAAIRGDGTYQKLVTQFFPKT